ncbi:MAG: RICIN domain-containing protein [Ruminococcus sp.]|nr:RICIN domain-containing protein [Ruminococcus sp.]
MKKRFKRTVSAALSALIAAAPAVSAPAAQVVQSVTASAAGSTNVVEYLDRGISAINTGSGMLVNWRWLASDSDSAVFKLYRDGTLIYTSEGTAGTCYLDKDGTASSKYRVDYLSGGVVKSSDTCKLTSNNAWFDIPLSPPSSIYSPNDMSVGDVDGDGQYELFLKWDPNNSMDNSQKGKTDPVYIDCYRLDGTRLWRINLGVNIRAGAHYTQFYVADFDLDGKCEMTCKTADGTTDAAGTVIGSASADYRNSNGYVLTGNEYYTLFDGATGTILDTVSYEPARGTVSSWGDSYGNRVDRFWGTVAYLDGVHPCVVTGRGYYTRMTATAYTVENKKLKKLWAFDTGNSSSAAGYGDGNHNSMPADVDGDGKQEVITGPAIIDDNGTLYYTTGQGHGDAMHVGDLDPTNPGIEVYICHEEKKSGYGVTLYDADQKKIIFHHDNANGDTGRCCGDNVWAGNPGAELWGNTENGGTPVLDVKGNTLSCRRPAINFLSYWDGDLEREILDGYTDSPATITKMNAGGTLDTILTTTGYYTCNTTKGTPCLSADIFGDWREELIVRAADSKSIRIYCTTYDTDYRITTLMHDPQYRMQVSAQNTAYNQPPHTSFFMGTGYDLPARPECTVNGSTARKPGAVIDESHYYTIKNVNSGLYLEAADGSAANGTNVQQGSSDFGVWKFTSAGSGYYYISSAPGDGTALLDVDYGKSDNGTNIGLYSNTNSDAQLYKLVDNGDGTYTICTKVSDDESCLGVVSGSKDSGANVVEWACTGSDDQKWQLVIKVMPFDGALFRNVTVYDTDNYQDWKIQSVTKTGSLIYGDREFTYAELLSDLDGSEALLTACDSKNWSGDLAAFTAGADMKVYVLLDQRVETAGSAPEWLGSWTKLRGTSAASNDVVYSVYERTAKTGETVTLGTNGMSGSCVSYAVLGMKLPVSGRLIKDLSVKDTENAVDWKIADNAASGSSVFGDRDVTYTQLPEELIGAEYIMTACDSKNSDSDLAFFTAGADIKVYVAVDSRVENTPAFLNDWTLEDSTAASSNDVTYKLYSRSFKEGELVGLGSNGQSAYCVNYTVFAVPDEETVTTTSATQTTQTTTVTETTTTTSAETSASGGNGLLGDANEDGDVNMADSVAIMRNQADPDNYTLTAQGRDNADVFSRGDGVTNNDALTIQKYEAGIVTQLPES